ncbi:MAG TPA: N-acetylgalactosamine-6-sulfatase [Planctomycetaceae bacterium]|nr:N-acetylgalactosamine-6-sulfatase [Planctomycetaceae bacterium]
MRSALRGILSLVVVLISHANAPAAKPNIVFILADDLGYRELGCYGQEKIKTPNIDRLAAEGMRFTQHYCGNAVCAPSRCVLLTGKHPGHAFVRDNKSTPPEGQWPIPAEEVTLPELLTGAGYATGVFGKWGLGGPGSSGQPDNQGVDRFFGYLCQAHAHSYYPSYLWSNDAHVELANNPPVNGHAKFPKGADPTDEANYKQFQGTDYAPDRINAAAIEFIREHKDEPFFLYYPSVIPHVALHVPEEDLMPYRELGWNDPPFTKANGYGYTPHFTPRAAYAAMISRLDTYVGRVLDELERQGLSENTIVIFSSDNGTTHLKQEVDYDFFASVGELRGLKGSLYEGGVRVPTIVRWPGKTQAGIETDYVSGFEDWLPTLLTVAQAASSIPENTDGVSLLPVLQCEASTPREYLYREFAGYGGQQSIRVGDYKAVRQNLRKGKLEIELYDLATDPGETKNIAADYPEVVERLAGMMLASRVPSEDFPIKALDELHK